MNTSQFIARCVIGALLSCTLFAEETTGPVTGDMELTSTLKELLGEDAAVDFADTLLPDEKLEWSVRVPQNYSADKPPGVLVWVSPTPRGSLPLEWHDVLGEQNIIWIGANDSGNNVSSQERMLKAILAPMILYESYAFDQQRSYIAGFSGGGRTAALIAMASPEQFQGGVYIAGSVSLLEHAPPKIEQMKLNRHVFMVGSYDRAYRNSRQFHNEFIEAGIENSKLIVIPNFGHFFPSASFLVEAIQYLDNTTPEQGIEQ